MTLNEFLYEHFNESVNSNIKSNNFDEKFKEDLLEQFFSKTQQDEKQELKDLLNKDKEEAQILKILYEKNATKMDEIKNYFYKEKYIQF